MTVANTSLNSSVVAGPLRISVVPEKVTVMLADEESADSTSCTVSGADVMFTTIESRVVLS